MRKLYLLLSVLPLWGPGGLFAQSCVSVRQVSTNYATKQITFDLTWGTCNNSNHLYRVWVFADYQPVAGLTKGAWSRAAITGSSAGTLHGNAGVWVTGTAGATQRVTLTVDVAPAQFNWCAVAIDYPPNAVINPAGGYTLRGTPPFTVNGVQLGNSIRGLAAGTCVTSITDATGNPEGRVPALPAVTTTNPAAVCAGKGVTLTATPGGGTTTANTYTWNIGGAQTTTTTNTFAVPAASITASKTFTVTITNANKCTSTVSNTGTITVHTPPTAPTGLTASPSTMCAGVARNVTLTAAGGDNGSGAVYQFGTGTVVGTSPAGTTTATTYTINSTTATGFWVRRVGNTACTAATPGVTVSITTTSPAGNNVAANACGCASGTTNCSGTCKTTGSYTINNGACHPTACNVAYVQLYNQCGTVVNAQSGTYTQTTCTAECSSCYQPGAICGYARDMWLDGVNNKYCDNDDQMRCCSKKASVGANDLYCVCR